MPKDRTGYAEMLAAQAKDDLPEGSAGVVMAQEESVREEWVEEVAITAQ